MPIFVAWHAVIWTAKPWTVPVNQACAYGQGIEYVLLAVTADTIGLGGSGDKRVNEVLTAAGYPFNVNRIAKFLVAKDLATSFADRLNKAAKALDFGDIDVGAIAVQERSEEHTSELQSLMRNSYAVLCLTKKTQNYQKQSIID